MQLIRYILCVAFRLALSLSLSIVFLSFFFFFVLGRNRYLLISGAFRLSPLAPLFAHLYLKRRRKKKRVFEEEITQLQNDQVFTGSLAVGSRCPPASKGGLFLYHKYMKENRVCSWAVLGLYLIRVGLRASCHCL